MPARLRGRQVAAVAVGPQLSIGSRRHGLNLAANAAQAPLTTLKMAAPAINIAGVRRQMLSKENVPNHRCRSP